jgi:hypothetical protein
MSIALKAKSKSSGETDELSASHQSLLSTGSMGRLHTNLEDTAPLKLNVERLGHSTHRKLLAEYIALLQIS